MQSLFAIWINVEFDAELDTQGLLCPEPLMLVRKQVRELEPGAVLHVLASDPTTSRDFSNFCHFMGHELLGTETVEDAGKAAPVLEYWIRKGN
jgi:tRNA 2-thiouridine synthesizing protein A